MAAALAAGSTVTAAAAMVLLPAAVAAVAPAAAAGVSAATSSGVDSRMATSRGAQSGRAAMGAAAAAAAAVVAVAAVCLSGLCLNLQVQVRWRSCRGSSGWHVSPAHGTLLLCMMAHAVCHGSVMHHSVLPVADQPISSPACGCCLLLLQTQASTMRLLQPQRSLPAAAMPAQQRPLPVPPLAAARLGVAAAAVAVVRGVAGEEAAAAGEGATATAMEATSQAVVVVVSGHMLPLCLPSVAPQTACLCLIAVKFAAPPMAAQPLPAALPLCCRPPLVLHVCCALSSVPWWLCSPLFALALHWPPPPRLEAAGFGGRGSGTGRGGEFEYSEGGASFGAGQDRF